MLFSFNISNATKFSKEHLSLCLFEIYDLVDEIVMNVDENCDEIVNSLY